MLERTVGANVGLLIVALVVGGCSRKPSETKRGEDVGKSPDPMARPVTKHPAAKRPAVSPAAARQAVSAANRDFGFTLFAELARRADVAQAGDRTSAKRNVFLSPYSISAALAMLYAGARGKTAKQLSDVLGFDALRPRDLLSGYGALDARLGAGAQKHSHALAVANRVWGQRGFAFEKPYLALLGKHFGAALKSVDFKGDPSGALGTINGWVSKKTMKRIPKLLKPSNITKNTRCVLTNAIYLKADWWRPFEKEGTEDAPFYITATRKTQVKLMQQTHTFAYGTFAGYRLLELPYKGKELSMVVLLPRKIGTLDQIIKKIQPKRLAAKLERLHPTSVKVSLPRFTFRSRFLLSQALKKLGLRLVFGGGDLSGVTRAGDFRVSEVIHEAFVRVEEKGTEAAAATAVVGGLGGGFGQPAIPVFRVDHPFLFIIRHRASGLVLFVGRVINPGQAPVVAHKGPPPSDVGAVPPPRRPRMIMHRPSVKGAGLDRTTIRRIVRRHMNELKYCYMSIGLPTNPKLQGRVVVDFTIGTKNTVSKVAIRKTTLNHKTTERCIQDAVRRWRFPKPEPLKPVQVTYPFTFKPR